MLSRTLGIRLRPPCAKPRYRAALDAVGERPSGRRIRVVIDIERREPTDPERKRDAEGIAATPNAIDRPFGAVWFWRILVGEPPGPLSTPGGGYAEPPPGEKPILQAWMRAVEDEPLANILMGIRATVPVEIARQLSGSQVPIDRRFAELIGTGTLPRRAELAERTAALLGLSEPTTPEAENLLVDIVLLAHEWYYDLHAPTESTDAGNSIGSRAASSLSRDELRSALADLHMEQPDATWTISTELLSRMGFRIW